MRRALRGTEAPASRVVRLSQVRYDAWRRGFEAALVAPPEGDPLSATLSRIARARWLIQDEASLGKELRRAVEVLWQVLSPRVRS